MIKKIDYISHFHLIFKIKNDSIHQISLEESRDDHFTWEVLSETPDKKIRTQIDLWMHAFIQKKEAPFPLPLYLDHLPPFTLAVLSKLQEIPFGKTTTYQQLACDVGSPLAARAVGNACARNPMLLVIPCHRVLGKTGLGGFSAGGVEVKQQLLNFEKSSL